MKKLLSLPPNLVDSFYEITGYDRQEWFCTHDPVGHKLGSGGGTDWLLRACWQAEASRQSFDEWLATDKRMLIHAGGQSRRLPAYAPSGKVLTPIPVFRWELGQRLSQDLLSLQVPLYERILEQAPQSFHTLIASGDVLIRATEPLQPIPNVDVVCYGLWLNPETATHHGVFVSAQDRPYQLEYMLQKPSIATLNQLSEKHFYLTDIGVWLLSDKAVRLLMERAEHNGKIEEYDLYGQFGCALGKHPTIEDNELSKLSVAILPLPGGEFYHFGTSHELLSSTLAIQNLVNDQREIMHHSLKPHPAMFVQNAITHVRIAAENQNMWIENSWIGEQWSLASENIITGVPENNWDIQLTKGQCIDMVPIGEHGWVVRPYGYYDMFSGEEQQKKQYPVAQSLDEAGLLLRYCLGQDLSEVTNHAYEMAEKLSAEQISNQANLRRLNQQRHHFRTLDWPMLAKNHVHSVFYQVDLLDAAREFAANKIPLPSPLSDHSGLMNRIHDAMFRSEVQKLQGNSGENYSHKAFSLLREGVSAEAKMHKLWPRMAIQSDQIVWGRSPVRIDVAGGWTDTPPYCMMEGGRVVNFAVELNGQPPLQAYAKPYHEPHIILRSIDLGASETISTFEELTDFCHVGSPFSISKAALSLAGFAPEFCSECYPSLAEQLRAFGGGIELTTLSAVPAGSGLGTSSILAATVLGTLSDFCGLNWDKSEIGKRTLVLEQLLTTGGGWQDQFGGITAGAKLIQTNKDLFQSPEVRWLPDTVFTDTAYRPCHLLYYTGITRTAKNILAEIVRRMFLNEHNQLALLREMKEQAIQMYDAIQRVDFLRMGSLVRKTWKQNQLLDAGTNPEEIRQLTSLIDDLCLGYKLPGAGGGGFLYMVAKDPEAAARIKQIILAHPFRDNARFVEMNLSKTGLQTSRS